MVLTVKLWPLAAGLLLAPSPVVAAACDSIQQGYECDASIFHNWGQYSPYFTVPSNISNATPQNCTITFANVLSRHAARYPTSKKGDDYAALITKIHSNTTSYSATYAFIKNYTYALGGSGELTVFGEQEMVDSGTKFYRRYESLASKNPIFVRSSSSSRVVESAENFTQGYFSSCDKDTKCNQGGDFPNTIDFPYVGTPDFIVISEASGSNDTLNPSTCYQYENGYESNTNSKAEKKWEKIFVPAIQTRVNSNMVGANLSTSEIVDLMDLCPFNTVATANGTISPFCSLFTQTEWTQYNYLRSLDKWYADGPGNYLGATQGVGFVNELIARLTDKPVADETSTNHTLDSNQVTFPLNRTLYADFSHEDPITSILTAFGLFNGTAQLANKTQESLEQTNGFSAATIVPFASRTYFEKMACPGQSEELVRIIVNDRVFPLETCNADALGRCTLSNFVQSLSFAMDNGYWSQCGSGS